MGRVRSSRVRKHAGRVAGAVLGLALAAPAVQAADSHVLELSATVLSKSNCKFNGAGPLLLAFGSVDPSSTGSAVVSATTTFRCGGSAATATYSITSDDGLYEAGAGLPRMRHATDATAFLPYSLNLPQTGTVAKNVDTTVSVTATMAPADFADVIAGAYSDSVVLTIAP